MTEEREQYQTTALVKVDDVMSLGGVLAKSGYFQDARDAAQAVVKVLAGQELGLGPVASMTGVYIVKGRVTLSANLIASLIKRSRRYDYQVVKLDNTGCTLRFFDTMGGKRELIGESAFNDEHAKQAGLSGDNWSKFRRNMHFARAMSNGAKWFCPDVFAGPVYTPDELGAAVDAETGEIIDAQIIETPAPAPSPTPPPAPQAARATNGKRPYPPDVLITGFRQRIDPSTKERDMAPPSDAQLTLLRSLLSKILPNEDERHTFQRVTTGKASTKDMETRHVKTILDWLNPQQDGDKYRVGNEYARAEAMAVVRAEMTRDAVGELPGLADRPDGWEQEAAE